MKTRRLFCLLASVVMAMGAMAFPVSASYIDGDREVDYYSFDFEREGGTVYTDWGDDFIYRRYNRNWVASISRASSYAISYGVVTTAGIYPLANRYVKTGTGNIGNSYLTSRTNIPVRFEAGVDSLDIAAVSFSSGQWSPDNA